MLARLCVGHVYSFPVRAYKVERGYSRIEKQTENSAVRPLIIRYSLVSGRVRNKRRFLRYFVNVQPVLCGDAVEKRLALGLSRVRIRVNMIDAQALQLHHQHGIGAFRVGHARLVKLARAHVSHERPAEKRDCYVKIVLRFFGLKILGNRKQCRNARAV